MKRGKYLDFEDYKKETSHDPKIRERREEELVKLRLAHQIIKLRKRAKMTQAEFANKIVAKQQFVSMIESGRRMPSILTVCKIAQAFGKKLSVKFV